MPVKRYGTYADFRKHDRTPRGSTALCPFLLPGRFRKAPKEFLRSENVSYFEEGGSLFLANPDIFILLDKPPSRKTARTQRSLFSGRARRKSLCLAIWCEQDSLTPNGKRLPIHEERREAAGKYGGTGWHTFRHTYRSWLDDTGAPMGVQQKLMRHAQISTTMNVHGNALMTVKREANSKVVRMALRSA
jgi:hypothetical protein